MRLSGDNMMSVKRTNRSSVLYHLCQQGAMSRKMLAQRMGLTPAALTKIVGEMLDENLLLEGTTLRDAGGAGRAQVLLELNAHACCGLGVLLNVEHASLTAIWLDGSVIFDETIPIPKRAPVRPTVEMLSRRLLELADAHGLSRDIIIGIGVAVRGMLDANRRIVQDSFGALGEKNVPLAEMFRECTGLETEMNNNVRALFEAQMFLSHDHYSLSQLFLRCEYGIGASLSIRNEIWNGGNGRCAEIGHIPMVRRGGKPCACGKAGCLETIASPAAIRSEALSICSPERTPLLWRICQSKEEVDLNDILNAARNGDEGVSAIVDRAVRALGMALKSAIYIVDPQKIVLYGKLFDNSYFLSLLMADMAEGLDDDHCKIIIEKSAFNNLLEPMAAGILIVEQFFSNGGLPAPPRPCNSQKNPESKGEDTHV